MDVALLSYFGTVNPQPIYWTRGMQWGEEGGVHEKRQVWPLNLFFWWQAAHVVWRKCNFCVLLPPELGNPSWALCTHVLGCVCTLTDPLGRILMVSSLHRWVSVCWSVVLGQDNSRLICKPGAGFPVQGVRPREEGRSGGQGQGSKGHCRFPISASTSDICSGSSCGTALCPLLSRGALTQL